MKNFLYLCFQFNYIFNLGGSVNQKLKVIIPDMPYEFVLKSLPKMGNNKLFLPCIFQWVSSSHQVAKLLEFQPQHQSFQWLPRTDLLQDGLVGSSCSPRDSQESSPTSQFKSINFLVLNFLHSPTLTSIHDHWKNHSLDQTDLCWQSNVSAF